MLIVFVNVIIVFAVYYLCVLVVSYACYVCVVSCVFIINLYMFILFTCLLMWCVLVWLFRLCVGVFQTLLLYKSLYIHDLYVLLVCLDVFVYHLLCAYRVHSFGFCVFFVWSVCVVYVLVCFPEVFACGVFVLFVICVYEFAYNSNDVLSCFVAHSLPVRYINKYVWLTWCCVLFFCVYDCRVCCCMFVLFLGGFKCVLFLGCLFCV